ncbi:MAG: TM2 domain-containing protein [Bacteroidota bacterium]
MKKFLLLLTLSFVLLFAATTTYAVVKTVETKPAVPEMGQMNLEELSGISMDDFLNLTPKQIRKKTGKKLKLKQVIALKIAQKKIKKSLKAANAEGKPKSQLVALLLVILVGGLGIHRFYLGYTTIGIIQLLTLGGCGIWALIDLINIITGNLLPADGSDYDPTL